MTNSSFTTTFSIMLFIVFSGCGAQSTTSPQTIRNTETPIPSRDSTIGQSTETTIESKIMAKDGQFRFVICRASNLQNLAVDRRDSMAINDTAKLLKQKFKTAISELSVTYDLAKIDAKQIVNEHSVIFEKLAQKMTIESESSIKTGNSYAAYRIATLPHVELAKSFAPIQSQIAEQHELNQETQNKFSKSILSKFSVGWAGNDNEFVYQLWTDPMAKPLPNGEQ